MYIYIYMYIYIIMKPHYNILTTGDLCSLKIKLRILKISCCSYHTITD